MTVRMTMKEWAHGWALCLFGLLVITTSPALAETPAAILQYDTIAVTTLTTGRALAETQTAGAMECWAMGNADDDASWREPRCPRLLAPMLSLGGPDFARLEVAAGR
jgi:hypothetical protein